MNIDEEFKQIISDVEFTLNKKDTLSAQQIGTNIVNSLVPKHYDTISMIYKRYPELEDLEGAGADIEISSDNKASIDLLDNIATIFKMIKQKYNC